MRKSLLIIALFLVTSGIYAQSRYLPLGVNGSSFTASTMFNGSSLNNIFFSAGYGIGGRIDLTIRGGALFENIEGNDEVVPTFMFDFAVVMLKQQKAVPFSLTAGIGLGFGSVMSDDKSIFGSDGSFDMLLSHDFHFADRFIFGINGIFRYNWSTYDIRDPASSDDPTSVAHLYNFLYGTGIDIGLKYYKENLLVLRFDVLWDKDFQIMGQCKLFLIVPSFI